jgi:hypothetical protein
MIRLLIAIVCVTLLFPAVARSQSSNDLLDQGIRAYGVREYDGGAWLLRRALAMQGADALSRTDAARALMYLSATELARNQRDSALAVARRLIVLDPRYRPDDRTFSPQAMAVLQEARRSASTAAPGTSSTVGIRAVGDTAIRPGTDAFTVRLVANSAPEVSAAVTGPDGRVVRSLYQGTIRDSVDVRWNGLDQSGNSPPAGKYAVTVVPTARERRGAWVLRLPIEVTRPTLDTMPLPLEPPDSLFRPERGDYQGAWRALVPSVAAGVAIIVLPKIVASDDRPSNARLVVGGTVTAAGIAAFLWHRPGRSLPANEQYNRTLRETWRRNVADVSRRNADGRRQSRIVIRPGIPVFTVSEAP